MVISIRSSKKEIRINELDERGFNRQYFAHCLDCSFCHDICCSYGCQLDLAERDRILVHSTKLEARLGIPSSRWFQDTMIKDEDYPSGAVLRTRVYQGKCVFYDHKNRGCSLHKFAQEEGMDWHEIKPMVCSLFPFTWEGGRLFISDFLDELPCRNQGISILDAQRSELRFYFGDDLVSELERIALSSKNSEVSPLKPLDTRPH